MLPRSLNQLALTASLGELPFNELAKLLDGMRSNEQLPVDEKRWSSRDPGALPRSKIFLDLVEIF
jgi:hypothetical protein